MQTTLARPVRISRKGSVVFPPGSAIVTIKEPDSTMNCKDDISRYKNSSDGKHRFWQCYKTNLNGAKVCLAIMFNPTGKNRAPGERGATIKTCLRFAEYHGCSELRTCNLFARKDYPDGANKEPLPNPPDPVEIRRQNDQHIVAEIAKADVILCAWGDLGPQQVTDERAQKVLALLAGGDTDGKLYVLDINKSGRPKHPARASIQRAFRVSIAGGKLVKARQ